MNQASHNEEENLTEMMNFALDHDPKLQYFINYKRIIEKLKFKNVIYCPGDNIKLMAKEGKNKHLYGKILLIAKVQMIDFPVFLVAWYFNKYDPMIVEQGYTHLSKRELIFSEFQDWQYVESTEGKLNVLDEMEYKYMNPKEKAQENTYFCRSYILPDSPALLNITPKGVCFCMIPYNLDDHLVSCALCGILFHPSCAAHDQICTICQ